MVNVAIGLFVECCETHDVCGSYKRERSVNSIHFLLQM